MGNSKYGATSGSLVNGGEFVTAFTRNSDKARAASGHTLLAAVSSSIAAATGSATGTIGAGWMSSGTVGSLSASYLSATSAGV